MNALKKFYGTSAIKILWHHPSFLPPVMHATNATCDTACSMHEFLFQIAVKLMEHVAQVSVEGAGDGSSAGGAGCLGGADDSGDGEEDDAEDYECEEEEEEGVAQGEVSRRSPIG
jgi:hypothetical protein